MGVKGCDSAILRVSDSVIQRFGESGVVGWVADRREDPLG
jgi:hypothetical protein